MVVRSTRWSHFCITLYPISISSPRTQPVCIPMDPYPIQSLYPHPSAPILYAPVAHSFSSVYPRAEPLTTHPLPIAPLFKSNRTQIAFIFFRYLIDFAKNSTKKFPWWRPLGRTRKTIPMRRLCRRWCRRDSSCTRTVRPSTEALMGDGPS